LQSVKKEVGGLTGCFCSRIEIIVLRRIYINSFTTFIAKNKLNKLKIQIKDKILKDKMERKIKE